MDMEPMTTQTTEPVAPAPEETTSRSGMPKHVKKTIATVLIAWAALLALVAPTFFVYAKPTGDAARKIVNVIPYPAVIVNGSYVSMKEFLSERDALVNYFSMTGTTDALPTDSELDRQIVDTLINKAVVLLMADEEDITLDTARTDEFYTQVLSDAGGEDAFETQLQATFGWTPEQFRERVVDSVVLATQVSEWVAASADIQKDAKATADQAYVRLQSGEGFATVAGEMSQDSTAPQGGDVGFVPDDQLPPEWGDQVRALSVGQYTNVIDTKDAFLIFQLTDQAVVEDSAQRKLSVIVIPKKTLDDVVTQRIDDAKIYRLVGKE
jgi:parvulin-like peptidyl-prolyl isomerase